MSELQSYDSKENEKDLDEHKYLTFKIGEEQYGVGIESVIEIIEMIKITPMPDMNNYIKGVINLRGKVIPVMDVRLRFSMPERAYDEKTCIIVVTMDSLDIGLIVDTVSEVVDISPKQIEPPPKLHSKIEQHYIMGIGKVENQVNLLLDLSKLLFENELERIKKAS
ncbi:MAG: purine-binding chemotaxis protein CheW [Oligoflexales bacterium]|nr:purine-binding chemotaxis protein CheW [Oligoflexales bacterium]